MKFVPGYYESNESVIDHRCGKFVNPRVDQSAQAGREYAIKNKIKSSAASHRAGRPNIILSVIDMQLDFIAPDQEDGTGNKTIGSLCVPGAVGDVDRLNRFIYANIESISSIVASLDTHYLFQPFHRFNWEAGESPTVHAMGAKKNQAYVTGENPDPFTMITLKDVQNDTWRPVRHPQRMLDMLTKLEQTAKKNLMIWPLHCILGTPGHAFDSTFMEAVFFHAAARSEQYDATVKGMSSLSEHYGILKAEVEFSDDPNTQLNTSIVNKWEKADRIYFAGEAKSHCVLETLSQVVEIFTQRGKNQLLEKLYVLEDCMSSVPDVVDERGKVLVPFDEIANAAFSKFKKSGVKFVKSTDSIVI